jgi:hypothetical protein
MLDTTVKTLHTTPRRVSGQFPRQAMEIAAQLGSCDSHFAAA